MAIIGRVFKWFTEHCGNITFSDHWQAHGTSLHLRSVPYRLKIMKGCLTAGDPTWYPSPPTATFWIQGVTMTSVIPMLLLPVDNGAGELHIRIPLRSNIAVITTASRPVYGEETPPRTTVALDQQQMRELRDWLSEALGEG